MQPTLDPTTRAALEAQYRELKAAQAQINRSVARTEAMLGKVAGSRAERRADQGATVPRKAVHDY